MNQEFQAQVIAACKEHRAKNLSYDNLNDKNSLYVGEYFVKFGYQRDLEPERATQEFFFNYAQAQAQAQAEQPQTETSTSTPRPPRIAKIVHHFVEKYTMYLVMERIKLQESPPDLPARIHEAMKWLSEVPPPPNSTLGPVGGGPIRHNFFQEFVAPFTFSDTKTLDQYVNKVYRVLAVGAQRIYPPVSISGERLMYTQSNMDESNFGVDEHGRTVLMDFGAVGLLPETFVAMTLSGKKFGPLVADLGLSGNPNLRSMALITACMQMISNPTLGMAKKSSTK